MSKIVSIPQSSAQELIHWYSEHLIKNTPVRQGTIFSWLFGLFGQAGVTVNKTIHLTKRAPDPVSQSGIVLIGHELYHVLQQQEMGWYRFLFSYIWHWRPRHIKNGREHPLEKPAYARGDEIRNVLAD